MPGLAELDALLDQRDAEPRRAGVERGPRDRHRAVAVAVGLHHREQLARARRRRAAPRRCARTASRSTSHPHGAAAARRASRSGSRGEEPDQIAAGDDADRAPLVVDDRHVGDVVVVHQRGRRPRACRSGATVSNSCSSRRATVDAAALLQLLVVAVHRRRPDRTRRRGTRSRSARAGSPRRRGGPRRAGARRPCPLVDDRRGADARARRARRPPRARVWSGDRVTTSVVMTSLTGVCVLAIGVLAARRRGLGSVRRPARAA